MSKYLLLLAMVSSCSLISKAIAEKPKVELLSVQLKKISWTSIDLSLELDIQNPNSFEIGLNELSYVVNIGDKQVGQGHFKDDFKVAGKSHGIVMIPFTLDSGATLDIAKSYLGGQIELKAQVLGNAEFSTPLGSFAVPIDESKMIVKPNS